VDCGDTVSVTLGESVKEAVNDAAGPPVDAVIELEKDPGPGVCRRSGSGRSLMVSRLQICASVGSLSEKYVTLTNALKSILALARRFITAAPG
jgi:hypothetical protein